MDLLDLLASTPQAEKPTPSGPTPLASEPSLPSDTESRHDECHSVLVTLRGAGVLQCTPDSSPPMTPAPTLSTATTTEGERSYSSRATRTASSCSLPVVGALKASRPSEVEMDLCCYAMEHRGGGFNCLLPLGHAGPHMEPVLGKRRRSPSCHVLTPDGRGTQRSPSSLRSRAPASASSSTASSITKTAARRGATPPNPPTTTLERPSTAMRSVVYSPDAEPCSSTAPSGSTHGNSATLHDASVCPFLPSQPCWSVATWVPCTASLPGDAQAVVNGSDTAV